MGVVGSEEGAEEADDVREGWGLFSSAGMGKCRRGDLLRGFEDEAEMAERFGEVGYERTEEGAVDIEEYRLDGSSRRVEC